MPRGATSSKNGISVRVAVGTPSGVVAGVYEVYRVENLVDVVDYGVLGLGSGFQNL